MPAQKRKKGLGWEKEHIIHHCDICGDCRSHHCYFMTVLFLLRQICKNIMFLLCPMLVSLRRRQLMPFWKSCLTLNFLVAVVNTLNTKTHSSKETDEFSVEDADVKSICYRKQKVKSKLSLSSECVETTLCKLRTSFTSHLHSSCGTVWYRTLRVKS